MRVNSIKEIPSGLMQGYNLNPNITIENAELRMVLDKAVEDAELNVTERMALNRKFFPNGNGFKLFPEKTTVHKFNFFHNGKGNIDSDTFTKSVESVKFPETVCRIQKRFYKSSKDNFSANLDNALVKLKRVLKGNI